jgi:hypothetical protein
MCRRRATTSGGTARPPTRDLSDAHLIQQLRAIHAESRQTYGVRRCRAELRLGDRRLAVPHKRVARLMRIAGLQGVHRRRWRHSQPAAAVWETECSAASTPTGPTSCGAPTSPSTAPARAGSTPRSCSTCSPAGSSAGQSRTTCAPSWSSMRYMAVWRRRPAGTIIHSDLRMDRGVLQPDPAPLRPRLPDPDRLPNASHRSMITTLKPSGKPGTGHIRDGRIQIECAALTPGHLHHLLPDRSTVAGSFTARCSAARPTTLSRRTPISWRSGRPPGGAAESPHGP